MAVMRKVLHPAMTPLRRAVLGATLSLALLSSAQALTLARPQVQSHLGEPFKAEVDFADIAPDELPGLQARLAEGSVYQAVRLELPPVPLQIELLQRPNGRPYLRLSSTQAVQRKTIDVLLLLRWANGQLLRDFSVTLDEVAVPSRPDPAPLRPMPAAVVETSAPPTVAPPATPVASPPPKSPPASQPPSSPTSPPKSAPASSTRAPTSTPADTARRSPKPSDPTNATRLNVKPGDTASSLVAPVRPASVSLDQMLLALLRQNPDAFVDQNVHRLKAGSVLQVPSAEQAQATPAGEAHAEIRLQTENFNTYRAELANWAGRGDLAEAERQSSGQVSAQVQAPSRSNPKDQLTLTRPQDARAQDQLARQKEAREVAQRAAELGRNVSELGRLAAEVASAGGDGPNLPAPPPNASWLDELSQNPLTPVAAGALIALLVLLGLWRQRRVPADAELPPLKVDFDLDLPDLPSSPEQADTARPGAIGGATPAPDQDTRHAAPTAAPATARPRLGIPDISLDLEPSSAHPLEVRLELAQQLWDLGQHHTSRALVEEVIAEAQGELQERARQWLAQRS